MARRSVLPPSRRARQQLIEADEAPYPTWPVMSGNVSVISREFHNLQATAGGDVTAWHIMSGNVPVVSLELWKLRDMKAAARESESLPGDWTARIDQKSSRTYYYSRKLRKTQWVRPEKADGSYSATASAGSGGTRSGAGGAGAGAGAGGGSTPEFNDALDGKPYDWVPRVDKGSGRTYYFSKLRHKTQWGEPAKVAAALQVKENDWIQKKVPGTGRTYYFSPSRNVTSWTKPEGVTVMAASRAATTEPVKAVRASKKVPLNQHGLPGDWEPLKDRGSGRVYYFSKELKKTQWTRPKPEVADRKSVV